MDPGFAERLQAAAAAQQGGRLGEARTILEALVKVSPGLAPALHGLGVLAALEARWTDSAELLAQARAAAPQDPAVALNLGIALSRSGTGKAALEHLDFAQRALPHNRTAAGEFQDALWDAGLHRQALDHLEGMARRFPADPDVRTHLGLKRLALGDWERGWRDYEARLDTLTVGKDLPPELPPRWRGESLAGRTLVLHGEQGYGDVLQFARFVPVLVQKALDAGALRVQIEVQEALVPLFQAQAWAAEVVAHGAGARQEARTFPLLSAPFLFALEEADLPGPMPYLRPPESSVARCGTWLASLPRPRVGLVWAGGDAHRQDRVRSLTAGDLAPFAGIAGVSWVSLQKGPGEAGVETAQAALGPQPLLHLGSRLEDFADTAAVLAGLDLLITVDTAIGHLAGALGLPCWVLLRNTLEWRWPLHRTTTPWYPRHRLFRGDSPQVLRQLVEALEGWRASQ
ncbi:MAG: hypothetical protein IPL96_01700 [Holophagaceae bacterium]|nr:hypothetical protein [Holophagaceae bacterium]